MFPAGQGIYNEFVMRMKQLTMLSFTWYQALDLASLGLNVQFCLRGNCHWFVGLMTSVFIDFVTIM